MENGGRFLSLNRSLWIVDTSGTAFAPFMDGNIFFFYLLQILAYPELGISIFVPKIVNHVGEILS